MTLSIQFDHQGPATLIDTDGQQATLQSEFSAPPGSPLVGFIVGSRQRVQLKVRDCRRNSGDAVQYQLRGRWVSLSRTAREELLGSLADKVGP